MLVAFALIRDDVYPRPYSGLHDEIAKYLKRQASPMYHTTRCASSHRDGGKLRLWRCFSRNDLNRSQSEAVSMKDLVFPVKAAVAGGLIAGLAWALELAVFCGAFLWLKCT